MQAHGTIYKLKEATRRVHAQMAVLGKFWFHVPWVDFNYAWECWAWPQRIKQCILLAKAFMNEKEDKVRTSTMNVISQRVLLPYFTYSRSLVRSLSLSRFSLSFSVCVSLFHSLSLSLFCLHPLLFFLSLFNR